MSSSASWRDHAPPSSSHLRRSFTLPTRPTVRSSSLPPVSTSADGIETLFVCSKSKIVSFTTANPPRLLSPPGASSPPRPAPWTSPTERTLACGALRIYRVTASNVSFLSSGSLLHTIFPRSQCWCVDAQSVFVLRVRQDSYYRIELPLDTDDDKQTVEQFKTALAQVLQFEKTRCPFERDFEVEAPQRPSTPPRKTLKRSPSQTKAKKWILDKTWVPDSGPRPATPVLDGSDAGTLSSLEEDDRSSVFTSNSDAASTSPETVLEPSLSRPARRLSVVERASLFQGQRSVTAPAGSTRPASAVSMDRILEESPKKDDVQQDVGKPVLERQASEAASLASSADSFYSLSTDVEPSSSTAFLDAEADLTNPWSEDASKAYDDRGRTKHRRQTSEATVRVLSAGDAADVVPLTPTRARNRNSVPVIDVRPSSASSTPPLVSDSDNDSLDFPGLDVATPPDAIRLKRLTGASQRRAFSPMPQAKTLFVPPKQTKGKQITQAIVRKTLELVLGPPAHLVSLMLRIAANISDGFGFSTYRVRQAERPPGSWQSDEEDEWAEEDDFGIPISNVGGTMHRRPTCSGELD